MSDFQQKLSAPSNGPIDANVFTQIEIVSGSCGPDSRPCALTVGVRDRLLLLPRRGSDDRTGRRFKTY